MTGHAPHIFRPQGGGTQPKRWPAVVVAKVALLYDMDCSLAEVGRAIGYGQKTVSRIMRRYGIKPRPFNVGTLRLPSGERHRAWKGDRASYSAFHYRVKSRLGKADHCEECGLDDPNRMYDWANQTGRFGDVRDYRSLCRSCHRRFDYERNPEQRLRPNARNDVTPESVRSMRAAGMKLREIAARFGCSIELVWRRSKHG